MSTAAVFGLGLALGLRHALDADHVAVVGQMLERHRSVGAAARLAALWALGHSVTFLALGTALVVLGVRLPPAFETGVELAVAAMLIALGGYHLLRGRVARREAQSAPVVMRPLAIGLVHGLAGSAGIAVLTLTTVGGRAAGFAYLVLFCVGTLLGMIALTVLVAWSLGRIDGATGRLTRGLARVASVASVALGIAITVGLMQRG